jgi:hypothetical protein
VIVFTGVTVAEVVVDSEQVPSVTVSIYTPDIKGVAVVETVGFCNVEVNPSGPVQEYESIPFGLPVRLKVVPSQTGPLFPAVAPIVAAAVRVTVDAAAVMHVLSAMLRTVNV